MTRYLALDVGDERIGVAISDETGTLARPYAVIRRVAGPESYRRLAEIIAREGVAAIIVGLPLREDRTPGKQAASVEAYVRGMTRHIDLPVRYWDERYTTAAAEEILDARDRRRPKEDLDAVAAAVILQDYLDQRMEER